MILNLEQNDGIKIGTSDGLQMGIDLSDPAKIFYILSQGFYKDPKRAIVQEVTSNIYDSVIASGKDILEFPGYIILTEQSISFLDYGEGISEERMKKIMSKFFATTKNKSSDQLGCWGLGFKAIFSYSPQFTVVSVHEGVRRTWLFSKDVSTIDIVKLKEEPVSEPNQTSFSISINNDARDWYDTIVETIPYFKGILFDCQVENTYYNRWNKSEEFNKTSIIEGRTFYYRKDTSGYFNVCLDQVIYRLNTTDIDLPYGFSFPFSLKFGLQEGIIPLPNRESLVLTESTKSLIRQRLKECIEELHEYYEENVQTLTEYFKSSRYITFNLAGENVQVENILNEVASELGAKSFVRFNPVFADIRNLLNKSAFFFSCVKTTGEIYKTKISPKRYYYYGDSSIILIDSVSNSQSKFLRENYEGAYIGKINKQRLWGNAGFYECLELKTVPRKKWKPIIEAWIKEQENYIKTIKVFPEEEYQEWLKSQTRAVGKRRKIEKEEIKIIFPVKKERGEGFKQEVRIIKSDEIQPGAIFVTVDTFDKKITDFKQISRVEPIIIDEKNLEKLRNVPKIQVYTVDEFENSKFFQRLIFNYWFVRQSLDLKAVIRDCYIKHNGILYRQIKSLPAQLFTSDLPFLLTYSLPKKYAHWQTYFNTLETKAKKIYLENVPYYNRPNLYKSYLVSKIKTERLEKQNQKLNEELTRCKQLIK